LASAPARLAGNAVLAVQSDARLVELARNGHERAFEAIVERYRKPLLRHCERLLPASRAEDAVQQAFISAHRALPAATEAIDLKPWLYKIAHNAALALLRQNGWNHAEIPADFDGVRPPDQVVEQREALATTLASLKQLPDRQRSALVMRELEGRSYDEIAVLLGAKDGAVRQLLNRARTTLRAAATALTPPPLLFRFTHSQPSGGGTRVVEAAGGLGIAGIAKAGATTLVAGSMVVGAMHAPLRALGNGRSELRSATQPGAGGDPGERGAATAATGGTAAPAHTAGGAVGGSAAQPGAAAGDRPGDKGHAGTSPGVASGTQSANVQMTTSDPVPAADTKDNGNGDGKAYGLTKTKPPKPAKGNGQAPATPPGQAKDKTKPEPPGQAKPKPTPPGQAKDKTNPDAPAANGNGNAAPATGTGDAAAPPPADAKPDKPKPDKPKPDKGKPADAGTG
jgi:RNA polymerase sigma factor (sigma-70 family)